MSSAAPRRRFTPTLQHLEERRVPTVTAASNTVSVVHDQYYYD